MGGSWYSAGLRNESILDVVVKPGDHQKPLAGTIDNGLFRSINGGGTWSDYHTNIDDKVVSGLVLHTTQPQYLHALTARETIPPGYSKRWRVAVDREQPANCCHPVFNGSGCSL